MKRLKTLTMLMALPFFMAVTSCGNIIPIEKDVDFNIDDVKFEEEGGGEDDEDEPGGDVNADIHSIYELNKGAMAENSHSNSWKYSSLEMDHSSYVELSDKQLSTSYPFYPRIKKMKNGQYLLLYQHEKNANDCYYAISDDLKTWTDKGYLFQRESKSVKYKNPDAVVLQNGDIIAVVCKQGKWIEMRRSTDNAVSWGAKKVIFTGGSMEPSILQLKSGEVQVYFTKCNTSRGYDKGYGDSGTGLLRSLDNGLSWIDEPGKIVRQKTGVWPKEEGGDGLPIYTDQMSVAIELNGDRGIAVASESRHRYTYYLTMSWCDNNWTEDREKDKVPADRLDNWCSGTGPYLRQFPSGESILSYRSDLFTLRLGNSLAREFDLSEPYQPFTRGGGGWGSVEVLDPHTLAATFPAKYDKNGNEAMDIMIGKFVLNHQIWANSKTINVDGGNGDWEDIQEALFIGSESDAQTCFRFAYSPEYLYVLVERLDKEVGSDDSTQLMFVAGDMTGDPIILNLTPNGNTVKCDHSVVTCSSFVNDATTAPGKRSGYLCELAIPRALFGNQLEKICFNAVTNDGGVEDGFTGLSKTKYDKWFPIMLKNYVQPTPEPGPGEGDNQGTGAEWSNGETVVNPW